jgi:hypothetical protein
MKDQKPHFSVVRIDPSFAETLSRYGVEFRGVSESNLFSTILSWIVPSILFVVIWMYVIRRMGEHGGAGGLMAIGKSKAKVYMETDTNVTFDDVELDGFMASIQRRVLSCSLPPIGLKSSIRRCCEQAASTGRCWSTAQTRPAASQS